MFHDRFDHHTNVPWGVASEEERKELAAALKAKPGRVALLARMARRVGSAYTYASIVNTAERHMYMFTPPRAYEATAVTVFDETRIYVRYTGERR